jgi:proliferating cell nuclear antigen PCNA
MANLSTPTSDPLVYLSHNAGQLKSVLDVLKDLVTDANIVFTNKEASLVAMDPEKVVAVALHLNQLFEYHCDSDTPIYFGINIPNLYKLVRGVSTEHVIAMEIGKETPSVLKITISHLTKGMVSVTSLYAIDLPKERIVLPEYEFPVTGVLLTQDLLRTLKNLSHGSKTITLRTNNTEPRFLTFSTKGDTYSYTTSISICPSEGGLHWKTFLVDEISGQYMIKYIEKFAKPQVEKMIELSMNGVLHLSYPDLPVGQFTITVAPILGENDQP